MLFMMGLISCDLPNPEVVVEHRLDDGDILQVTRIRGGPVGPEYAFELSYTAAGRDDAKVLTTWERPPGEAEIEVYEQPRCIVVLTPPRNVLHVRDATGHWQRWSLRDLVRQAGNEDPSLFIPVEHEPSATVATFDANTNVATVRVAVAGWPVQELSVELATDGGAVDVVSVNNPEDPRRAYLELFSLPSDTEILTIAKDLSGDGLLDVLVSHAAARNGKAGNIWTIFVATGQGFERIGEAPSIRLDSISGWTPAHPDAESPWFTGGITTYHPRSAASGTFVTYSLPNNILTTVATKRRDDNEYDRVFRSELVIPVTRSRFPEAGGDESGIVP